MWNGLTFNFETILQVGEIVLPDAGLADLVVLRRTIRPSGQWSGLIRDSG
jgi:hypothetical protein